MRHKRDQDFKRPGRTTRGGDATACIPSSAIAHRACIRGLIIAANNLVKIQMAEAAIGGGCREAKKRKEVDVKSLLTEEYTEKKVKANFWERSEDAYVEDWRPSGRSAARGRSSPRRTRQWLTGCWQGWTSCCTSSLIKGSSSAGCVKHVRG